MECESNMKSFFPVYTKIVLAIAIGSFFTGVVLFKSQIPFIAFPFIVVEFILYYCYTGSSSIPFNRQKKGSWALFVIGIIAFEIGFTTLLIAGGGPEAIDTGYYIVNHGKILKEITYVTYRLLQLCETASFGGSILAFSALFCNAVS